MRLIGNTDIIGQIHVAMVSAQKQNRPIPHMLLSGAAGCGKTSTAKYIAESTGSNIITVAADSIKKREDVLPILSQLDHHGYDKYGRKIGNIHPSIVFVDEVHNVPLSGQEHMGILMEEWYLPLEKREAKVDPRSVSARNDAIRWSPEFTIIGATTNDGKLSKPFKDRFKLRFLFSPYSPEESADIVRVHADRLGVRVDDDAAKEIAKRGRGVPRILVSLLERCRDTAVAAGMCEANHNGDSWNEHVTKEVAFVTFDNLNIDKTGLTITDINILKALHESDEAIGLDNLAVRLNESPKVLSDTVEP